MDNASCACLSVEYMPEEAGGKNKDRWACVQCGAKFEHRGAAVIRQGPDWGKEVDRLCDEALAKDQRIESLEQDNARLEGEKADRGHSR